MFSNILLRSPQPSTEYDKDQKQHLQKPRRWLSYITGRNQNGGSVVISAHRSKVAGKFKQFEGEKSEDQKWGKIL